MKNRNILLIGERIFRISYLLLAIITFNSFLFGKPIASVLVNVTFILGSILIVERIVHWKEYIGTPYLTWLILFIFSFIISSVVNFKYEFVENMKWVVWTTFQMMLLYTNKRNTEVREYKKEFVILSNIIIVYTFMATVMSFVLLIMDYSQIWIFEENGQRIIAGFVWGRLWGVYTDPNYGAVLGVISIILSVYFIQKNKIKLRLFYIINIIFEYIYIVFSDSRTGKLTLLISISLYIYCMLLKNAHTLKGKIRNILLTVGVCVLMICGMSGIKNGYNAIMDWKIDSMELPEEAKDKEQEEQEIGREEDIKEDPSNRRFSIWKSGIEILETAPLFGTGYVSFISYTMEKLPDTYVVNNDYGVFGSMHNGFLNVLVYQGIIGFLIFIAFVMCVTIKILKTIWKLEREQYQLAIVLSSCIGAVVCSMMFLLEGTYTNSIGSIVLWSFLGWLVQVVSSKSGDVELKGNK